jgi:predicted lipoprotein
MTMKPLATSFLAAFAGAILAGMALPASVGLGTRVSGTAPIVSKQSMLENIGRNVLGPGYSQLAASADELSTAADALVAAPTAGSLGKAQDAWKRVLLAWRRTQSYAHGPADDLGIYPRIQFWPPRRQAIDRVLHGQRPIDEAYVQELGANTVGLSALELILFDPATDEAGRLAAFTGPAGERERQFFQGLVRDLTKQTRRLASSWQGSAGYATTFGAGGQQQLDLLVNDILEAIETGAENRLRVVLERHAEKRFRSELLEGGTSGMSQEGLLALLAGARAVFLGEPGIGIDDYLRALKSPSAARMDAQLQKTIDAVQALGGPLEDAIVTREAAVRRAHEECRTLEIMLKTEVASTLGVTLTFKARDGD